jgi:hypothetical protein
VLDAVRAGHIPKAKVNDIGIIVAVWLDPSAGDTKTKIDHEVLFRTHREAPRKAIAKAMNNEPSIDWLLKNQKKVGHYFHELALQDGLGLLVALLVTAICLVVAATGLRWGRVEITEIIQTSEAGLSEAVLIGAGLLFLIGWERRLKRSRALRALHELRSVAHVIDMHQLTKDPERLLERYSSTKASPRETMTAFELNRYLDYCSELLSLTGKVAAVYVQWFEGPAVLEAVAEIEDLTTGLCQKIWQKVSLIQRVDDVRPAASPEG